jgi:DNA repair protein REV1
MRMVNHTIHRQDLIIGEEYGESSFGGFGEYMRRKKLKLQNLDEEIRQDIKDEPQIFKGMVIYVMSLFDMIDG